MQRTSCVKTDAPYWEVILHASEETDSDFILDGFCTYLDDLDIKVDLDERLHAQGLCFMPVRIPRKMIDKVAGLSRLNMRVSIRNKG